MTHHGYCIHCRIWSDRLDRCGWCPECQRELATGKRRWYWYPEAGHSDALPTLTAALQAKGVRG